jgi:hypothetical protein
VHKKEQIIIKHCKSNARNFTFEGFFLSVTTGAESVGVSGAAGSEMA